MELEVTAAYTMGPSVERVNGWGKHAGQGEAGAGPGQLAAGTEQR